MYISNMNPALAEQCRVTKLQYGEEAGERFEIMYLGGRAFEALDRLMGTIINCDSCMLINADLMTPLDHLLPPPGENSTEDERSCWSLRELDYVTVALATYHIELTQRLVAVGIGQKEAACTYLPKVLHCTLHSYTARIHCTHPLYSFTIHSTHTKGAAERHHQRQIRPGCFGRPFHWRRVGSGGGRIGSGSCGALSGAARQWALHMGLAHVQARWRGA
jgi:hypothetical protein